MEHLFTYSFHIPGTLASDLNLAFCVPVDCQLVHLSASATNANDAVLSLRSPTSGELFLSGVGLGSAEQPAQSWRTDFRGGQYPRLHKGSAVQVVLDFDGDDGRPAQNVTLALTFLPG
jgi:hypothetical protein